MRPFSRRRFFGRLCWAPTLFIPAPFHGACFRKLFDVSSPPNLNPGSELAESRLRSHFPVHSPLDDVLKFVPVGSDAYLTEKYAGEISTVLDSWSRGLLAPPPSSKTISAFLTPAIVFSSLENATVSMVRNDAGIRIQKKLFRAEIHSGKEAFIVAIDKYFSPFKLLNYSEMQVVGIRSQDSVSAPVRVETDIRFSFLGTVASGAVEERIGIWKLTWELALKNTWAVTHWSFVEETIGQSPSPIFRDVTESALGQIPSYLDQLLFGVDHWRSTLDGASGIDVYGNNGIAAGDFDGDGYDDLYICQPSGLPNRLYRNRGDGTFEDVTEKSGVGVLDATACAIFADFENKGLQDLLVVCASGPLLFLNQGNGKFELKRDAFNFATPPQGTFTHAAVADYDHDGRLDIYFCLYSYYLGLDQYHYPSPYFDARNGPPNFLFHNEGSANFVDRTAAAGLNAENDRFSFACAWGDSTSNGWPDLYVANDFGRSNLYRNRGDGTFEAISEAAGVNDPGAGMSACWADFDNSGKQDIYVSNMWSAARPAQFRSSQFFTLATPLDIRSLYRRHARGNSLYKNFGSGKFKNVSARSRRRNGPLGVVLRQLGFRPRRLFRFVHCQWLHLRPGSR